LTTCGQDEIGSSTGEEDGLWEMNEEPRVTQLSCQSGDSPFLRRFHLMRQSVRSEFGSERGNSGRGEMTKTRTTRTVLPANLDAENTPAII